MLVLDRSGKTGFDERIIEGCFFARHAADRPPNAVAPGTANF
jgi:hypothetical protein